MKFYYDSYDLFDNFDFEPANIIYSNESVKSTRPIAKNADTGTLQQIPESFLSTPSKKCSQVIFPRNYTD